MVNGLDIDVKSAEDEPDADPESGSTIGQVPASIELRFKRVETADGPHVEVTAIPSKEVRHLLIDDVPETLIALVMEDDIVMYPVNVNPTKADFLKPKYDQINQIVLDGCGPNFPLPEDRYSFDELLESLPVGFSRKAIYGLGLKWEYRLIPAELAKVAGINTINMSPGNHAVMDSGSYELGYARFDALRRGLDGITRRAQQSALDERICVTHNELLSSIDATLYPVRQPRVKAGTIVKIVQAQGDGSTRNASDRKAIVSAAQKDLERSAKEELDTVLALAQSIERVALKELTERLEKMLTGNHQEAAWQTFFNNNAFILGLAFAYPVYLLQDQAFIGNISLKGDGHSIVDFLLAQRCSGNIALIEIKHPQTKLLEKNNYRGSIKAPHRQLTGALTQVLHQRYTLMTTFGSKLSDPGLVGTDVAAVHCIVIAGRSPETPEDRRSLELFRNAAKDVLVITYDELLEKLKQLKHIVDASTIED
ncbi:hypothetical protein AC611_16810 [Xanthomonas phaseoli pv. phaseoli]|uniref:Shedu immune nuclease family protein n=1 Tax=Xanthomonas TaxID=338 RepID=UPI000FD1824B|nr:MULTISPECIES: Shedu immune nuclease family protein [Xanthomonas]AZU14303.1 hypothetical protein AC609_16775 [Xanthomonas phaseoli pv. phaseoli]AZU27064.1 hypothetical protein AC611_16810 [Xanthomonas phaseoli pv. phaseoli]AZU31406.1 hypothetical protein AC801_16510 [Xanthomonas sp. ISO98C4]AZU35828.1 hypothetical protein AC610_16765 [Xanthomonas phaseoli pv. phaseoli]